MEGRSEKHGEMDLEKRMNECIMGFATSLATSKGK